LSHLTILTFEHKRQASKNHDVKDQSIEKNVCEKMKKEREGGGSVQVPPYIHVAVCHKRSEPAMKTNMSMVESVQKLLDILLPYYISKG